MSIKKSRELQLFNEAKRRELDYYKDKYRRTLKEWEKFVTGRDDIDETVIPPEVLTAWIRCRNYGIDPLRLPKKNIKKGKELAKLLERNREFIDVSSPFLKNLYQFLKGSGFNVVLFDREGYLLEIMGDHDIAETMKNAGGVVGALWNEQSAGHNVSGTIIEVKRPIQIFGSQHYIKDYHGETGSGAPIFSSDGELLGGITLTARNFRVNPHTLGMAVAAAYAVENELRTRKAFAESQTAYRYQQAVITSIPEAMLTVDNFGIISLCNDPAQKLFSSPSVPAEGKSLSAVLAKENALLLKLIANNDAITDKEVRIFFHKAWHDYTLTLTPIISAENEHIGKIVVLNEIKRARTMVTKMLGARAAYRFEDICGQNPKFLVTIEQAKMVARNDSNVLLLGKSGTGKDIFAQSIHNASSRREGPYVAINCGAIPRDLIASELFGHEEGAFTGSRRGGSPGKFELADGGTIFLDEIAEIPLELQIVLLRVIEDKTITRIGGKQTRKIDVRIITATNKNLREEIEKGNFREDLFYRINVFNIEMIPLRERPDDIPLLTRWFIKKYEDSLGRHIKHVDDHIIEAFLRYSWPGNIRELQNVVERMMNFARANELSGDLIPPEIIKTRPKLLQISDLESPEENEKKMIIKMLELNFHKMKIAEKLNVSRATLYRKFKKYSIRISK
ncbi:MAG: sigma 54-interacting transcriptional regulator [Deltaproteobacteria bacterium]|nr:sigma 54-interacting transcriptional regulator [Deltaproteobacteria bacterium]